MAGGLWFRVPNSAFVIFSDGGGSSGGGVAAGGGCAPEGEGGRGLGVNLSVDPVEDDDQEVTESGSIAKFDLIISLHQKMREEDD